MVELKERGKKTIICLQKKKRHDLLKLTHSFDFYRQQKKALPETVAKNGFEAQKHIV